MVVSVGSSSSLMVWGEAVRVISVGESSLSSMVMLVLLTAVTAAVAVVPVRVMVSLPSTVLSSVTVRVKVAWPLVSPAVMVTSKASTGV